MKLDKKITQRQFYFAMIMLIIWLVFSVYSFYYFKIQCTMAKETPLKYIVKKYDLDFCTCHQSNGDVLFFNKSRAWIETSVISIPKISEEKGG